MKKFLSVAIFALVVAFSANICAANYYSDNPNYKFIRYDGVSGLEYYLNLRSVDVQEYNPPHYQIAGQFIVVDSYDGSEKKFNRTLRYNHYSKDVFYMDENGNWKISRNKTDQNSDAIAISLANALFSAAYGMDFY